MSMFEPIELELDKKRKVFLRPKALMRAEKKINQLREVPPKDWVRLDYMVSHEATETKGMARDLMATLLWAGLLEVDPNIMLIVKDDADRPVPTPLTVDMTLDLIQASPLTQGEIVTMLWDHYIEVTDKSKSEKPVANGADYSNVDVEGDNPLAPRPGSSSGPLQ